MPSRPLAAALSLAAILGGIIPSATFAQSPSTTTINSSTTFPNEGQSQFNNGEEQYWRRRSDTVRARVSQLPAEAVIELPIPILFGVAPKDLSPNFGDPRSGGRTHEGEDIMAIKDAPIISPTIAVVLDIGVWAGAGNYVSTANPGGETFVYMHLDKPSDLRPGDLLQPGSLIGYVGNTGNAAGGPTHLHFEIRKNGPTDPFPRLKKEFTPAEKMSFVSAILASSTDKAAMVQLLVSNYRAQFTAAQAAGLLLPAEISIEMARVPAGSAGAAAGSAAPNAASADLALGSHGAAVVTLQNFLIIQNKGPAARALGNAGATGTFGPITQQALIEYQLAVHIIPANGYYGALTRAYVQQSPQPVPPNPAIPPAPLPAPSTPARNIPSAPSAIPQRDLEVGARGTDVAWLQTFLIASHTGVDAQALIDAGATGYFGPATRSALAEYQRKAGIAPAAGYFGPATRAYVSAQLATR